MALNLTPQLESVIREEAERLGVTPELLALHALQDRFLPKKPEVVPQDEWERMLFGAAIDCGVSVPHSALSSEGLYE